MQRVVNAGPVLNGLLANGAFGQQSRNMATLKTISMRLKSVTNIQKITQSMKMVSAAKYVYLHCMWLTISWIVFVLVRYARAERELKQARPYGEGAKKFYEQVEIEPAKENQKELLIAITSDRGEWHRQIIQRHLPRLIYIFSLLLQLIHLCRSLWCHPYWCRSYHP